MCLACTWQGIQCSVSGETEVESALYVCNCIHGAMRGVSKVPGGDVVVVGRWGRGAKCVNPKGYLDCLL